MTFNLSNETVDTIVNALSSKKRYFENQLMKAEIGRASKDMIPVYESESEKAKDALQVFEK